MLELQFLGATDTVTGSKYLLTCADRQLMIDCGLFQGLKELRLRNWQSLPVEVDALSAILLTHAHIDHSGYLPRIVKQGYHGPIYATPVTADLCKILLPDSGRLQEEDALFANKQGFSKHHPALPLYTEDEEMRELVDRPINPLATRSFIIGEKRVNNRADGKLRIIISASGMCTGGRVLNHLKKWLPDEHSTVLLAGFQAEGTRGRRLLEGEREIKIHGETVPVRAEIRSITNLSAHADSDEIIRWLSGFQRAPRMLFITHGEPAAAALKTRIEQRFGWNVVVPHYLDRFDLFTNTKINHQRREEYAAINNY